MAESYAAWRFEDGTRAVDELAGVIMVDGTLDGAPVEQDAYEADGFMGPGLEVPSVEAIRAGAPLVVVPGVAPSAWPAVFALRARLAPAEVAADPLRDAHLAEVSFALDPAAVPPMTNAAALGFLYDFEYRPNQAITLGLGRTDGPTERHTVDSPFGPARVLRPTDPATTYGWVDAAATVPPERVPLATFAEASSRGGVDAVEWYFPNRLLADLYAVRGNAVAEDGWQLAHGLRALDGPLDDAPYLAVAASFFPATYDGLRARLAPAVGPDRPHAGAGRDAVEGFMVVQSRMFHAETTLAPDGGDNGIPAAIEAFLDMHAVPGTVEPTLP